MALISQSDLEARLGRSLTAEETSAFTLINASLQSQIEEYIGSSIETASATSRYFDGGVQHLKINPCTNITAVEYVDDYNTSYYTVLTSDYTTEPVNKTLKTMLRHRVQFPVGINNIKITAKFSIYADTATLNIIKDAMLNALVSEVQSTDNIKRESIEGYSVEYATVESKNALSTVKMLFPEVI